MSNTQEARPDEERGLYGKYRVTRSDGSSAPGGKHEHCEYFVLDLSHDPHALPALRAYADSCRERYPGLARDLERLLNDDKGKAAKTQTCSYCEGEKQLDCIVKDPVDGPEACEPYDCEHCLGTGVEPA